MVTELSYAADGRSARMGVIDRVLSGEVFVARQELQSFGLVDALVEASLAGIAKSMGVEAAERIRKIGFERTHEVVAAADIPKMTNAVYEEMLPLAPRFLQEYVPQAFPDAGPLYFERYPNVRFHIPYDLAADQKMTFGAFAEQRGEGKITAHGPHRDSWLNCPDNGVNVWIAIGPVRHGNGLTIYQDDNKTTLPHQPSGEVAEGEKLHKPLTFALEPGDAVIFHTDHLHGSELNRTNATRFVISFRMTFGKPHFPTVNVHDYVHAGWNDSFMKPFAMLPAKLQSSYGRAIFARAKSRLKRMQGRDKAREPISTAPNVEEQGGIIDLRLAELPVGAIKPLTRHVCVARLSDSECVAISRRCPHRGGDFSNGWIENGEIVCPWHNLNFNPTDGKSPCAVLPPLKRYACDVRGDRVVVDTTRRLTTASRPEQAVAV
jgi:nitrite reductase/ring-hydroxylating ferredoxin subunit